MYCLQSGSHTSEIKEWAGLVPSEAQGGPVSGLFPQFVDGYLLLVSANHLPPYACLCVQISPIQGQQLCCIKVTLMISTYLYYFCKDWISR